MNDEQSVYQIAQNGHYISGAKEFLLAQSKCFDLLRSQLLKYEHLEYYKQPESPAFIKFENGQIGEAKKLLIEERKYDDPIYHQFSTNGITMTRCRPVNFPINRYIDWEFAAYKYNENMGEKIFIANYRSIDQFLEQFANRDFMIFDSRIAFIQNHDKTGLLLGGWTVENSIEIRKLFGIFEYVKSNSFPFQKILEEQENGRILTKELV